MLPRKNRIPRKDFPSYKMKGIRAFSPYFSVVFYPEKTADSKESRASVVVSKKTAKHAVDRNSLRRRFYDAIKPYLKEDEGSVMIVLYPKIEAKNATFLALQTEIEKAFRQAKLIK